MPASQDYIAAQKGPASFNDLDESLTYSYGAILEVSTLPSKPDCSGSPEGGTTEGYSGKRDYRNR